MNHEHQSVQDQRDFLLKELAKLRAERDALKAENVQIAAQLLRVEQHSLGQFGAIATLTAALRDIGGYEQEFSAIEDAERMVIRIAEKARAALATIKQ